MLFRSDCALFKRIIRFHRGQFILVFIITIIVARFLIEFQESVEQDNLARCTEIEFTCLRIGDNINRCALKFGAFHLARERTRPNEIIKLRLIVVDQFAHLAWMAENIRRTNGFMRFLRIL